jgi:hypothetical protein
VRACIVFFRLKDCVSAALHILAMRDKNRMQEVVALQQLLCVFASPTKHGISSLDSRCVACSEETLQQQQQAAHRGGTVGDRRTALMGLGAGAAGASEPTLVAVKTAGPLVANATDGNSLAVRTPPPRASTSSPSASLSAGGGDGQDAAGLSAAAAVHPSTTFEAPAGDVHDFTVVYLTRLLSRLQKMLLATLERRQELLLPCSSTQVTSPCNSVSADLSTKLVIKFKTFKLAQLLPFIAKLDETKLGCVCHMQKRMKGRTNESHVFFVRLLFLRPCVHELLHIHLLFF